MAATEHDPADAELKKFRARLRGVFTTFRGPRKIIGR